MNISTSVQDALMSDGKLKCQLTRRVRSEKADKQLKKGRDRECVVERVRRRSEP